MERILAQPDETPVHPFDLHSLDRRSVAIYRAAQVLADAERCWKGLHPKPLLELDQDERIRYWQEARNVIEQFEAVIREDEPVTRGDLRVINDRRDGFSASGRCLFNCRRVRTYGHMPWCDFLFPDSKRVIDGGKDRL